MDDLLIVTAPPHIHSKFNLKKVIIIVILSLLPPLIAGIIYFGIYSSLVVVFSVLSSTLSEGLYEYLKDKKIKLKDGTAILTGLLLGMSLPPMVPLWIPVIGSAFAIIIVKQFFGGIGFNLLNPALTGRAFLTLTFPLIMTTSYRAPLSGTLSGIDVITQATPLTILKNSEYYGNADFIIGKFSSPDYLKTLLLGQVGGAIGETCKILLLISGLALLFLKLIDFRIVIGYLLSFLILNLVFLDSINPLFQLFSGGVLLAIFFMATDWVTTPLTKNGRWIFGIGCGLFTVLLRRFSVYPEGITPSILLMNLLTPLIDKLTIKRRIECQKT